MRKLARLLGPERAEKDHELVAAEPGDRVGLADASRQDARHVLQQLVSGVVAEGVVHLLEPIHVEEENRTGVSMALAPRQVGIELVEEAAPVEEPGQRVVVGQIEQPLLRSLLRGDVEHQALKHSRAVRVHAHHRVVSHPNLVALTVEQPVFARERHAVVERALLGLQDRFAVLRMHEPEPEPRIRLPLLGAVAEQLLDLRADEVPFAGRPELGRIAHGRNPLDELAVVGARGFRG